MSFLSPIMDPAREWLLSIKYAPCHSVSNRVLKHGIIEGVPVYHDNSVSIVIVGPADEKFINPVYFLHNDYYRSDVSCLDEVIVNKQYWEEMCDASYRLFHNNDWRLLRSLGWIRVDYFKLQDMLEWEMVNNVDH